MIPQAGAPPRGSAPVLLFDDACVLCNGTVRFLLRHDRRGALRFGALTGAFGRGVTRTHPELAGIDSLVWVEDDRVWIRSEAVLRAAEYLGGGWRWLSVARVVPRTLRDWVYNLIARYRYRVFGRLDACPLPPPEWRARFLD